MSSDNITFSFGENWRDFVKQVDKDDINRANEDILSWISADNIAGKRVLDIGCGSGLHSYCFYNQKVSELVSIDVDKSSVDATHVMREYAGEPDNWQVDTISVLDNCKLEPLGVFNIVYSWGVLHHTGKMWEAIENAAKMVDCGGLFFISLYKKGEKYPKDLAIKRHYNNLSSIGKKLFVYKKIIKIMWKRLKKGKNPFAWNERVERGMNRYHDLIDWYGGLPYEVASTDEVEEFLKNMSFEMVKFKETKERCCNVYLFKKK
ncbi:MAG: class I SAM-dependent methyltransferase [Gammaproteobacteria bacterium]|nr:class I SAM-dependent methyltransferase [Gammaproteobacteria bacterium]